MNELKIAQLKNKEAKLAFDLAVAEIPALENDLFDTIALSLEARKATKQVQTSISKDENPQTLTAIASKFSILFGQLLDLEEQYTRMGLDCRKFLKTYSDMMRAQRKFAARRAELEDSARDAGFDLQKSCGFLYQDRT